MNNLEVVCILFKSFPTERSLIYLVAVMVIIAAHRWAREFQRMAIWFTMTASAHLNWKVV